MTFEYTLNYFTILWLYHITSVSMVIYLLQASCLALHTMTVIGFVRHCRNRTGGARSEGLYSGAKVGSLDFVLVLRI